MEGKSGVERRLIFRGPGRLLSSVPDGVAGQKGHFTEFLSEWLRWLSINKREDLDNVSDVFSGNKVTWCNFKTSQITGVSIIQNIRNKVAIFLSFTIVSFLDVIFKWHCQLNQVCSIVPLVWKDHIGLELRNNDVNWEGTSSGRVSADVTKKGEVIICRLNETFQSSKHMRLKGGGLVLSTCKILFYHQNWENSTVKKCKVSALKCFLFELNWIFGSEVTVFLSEEAWKFGNSCYTFMCKTLNLLFLTNSLKIFFG